MIKDLFIAAVLAIMTQPVALQAQKITLAWDPPTQNCPIVGYNIYRSIIVPPIYDVPSRLNSTPVQTSGYTDTAVQSGVTYYYVVRTVSDGVTMAPEGLCTIESANSNEVSASIDGAVVSITAAPDTVIVGDPLTVSWKNIPSATGGEYFSLFKEGDPANSQFDLDWILVNCSYTATVPIPTGSCPYTIKQPPGRYYFGLFTGLGGVEKLLASSMIVTLNDKPRQPLPAATGLGVTCSADGKLATAKWNAVPDSTDYWPRGAYTDGTTIIEATKDGGNPATTISFPVTPGRAFDFWVHGFNALNPPADPTWPMGVGYAANTTATCSTTSKPPDPPTNLRGTIRP